MGEGGDAGCQALRNGPGEYLSRKEDNSERVGPGLMNEGAEK